MNKKRMKYIGQEIRRERRSQDKTLSQVALAGGLAENTISAYEKGKIQIPIDNLDNICNYLNIYYIDLLTRVQERLNEDAGI